MRRAATWYGLLGCLQVAHTARAVPVLRRVAESNADEEVLATCLQLLGSSSDPDMVRGHANHPSSLVRSRVAQALGEIATEQDRPLLLQLLCDPAWCVRYRAAQALVALPFVERQELVILARTMTDRFARDMLRFVLSGKE